MPRRDVGFNEGNILFTLITIMCATVEGYEDPFWTITNKDIMLNPIINQTVDIRNGSDVAILSRIQQSRHLTSLTISANFLFPDELNGTYICQTPNNSFTTSVVLTNSKFV